MNESNDVISFWKSAGYEKWFSRDDAFDAEFDQRFRGLHFRAARRELEGWMGDAEGALALILLLDQFPRNCFRGLRLPAERAFVRPRRAGAALRRAGHRGGIRRAGRSGAEDLLLHAVRAFRSFGRPAAFAGPVPCHR